MWSPAANSSVRWPRAFRRTRFCSPASARPRPNCARRLARTFSASTSNPSPNSNCSRGWRSRWAALREFPCASIRTSIPARTQKSPPASPQNKFGVPLEARARRLCPRREAAGTQGHRRRCAHRQPDHRSRSARSRVQDAHRFRAYAARRRPHHLAMSISAAGSAFPIISTGRAAGAGGLCRDGQARQPTISAAR